MKRPIEHITDERGEDLLKRMLPAEWITRKIPKDYGVDLEVEIVEREIVTGQRIWTQLKSTSRTVARTKRFDDDVTAEYVPFRLETAFVQYALSCPYPLLLSVADLGLQEVYWLPIRDHVLKVLDRQNPAWRSQSTVTVTIPRWNRLSLEREQAYFGIRWYSLEPSRHQAFSLLTTRLHGMEANGFALYGYAFDADRISPDQATALGESLSMAREYISDAMRIEVLFGQDGPSFLRDQLRLDCMDAVAQADAALGLLRQGTFDVTAMNRHLFRVDYAVKGIANAVNLYPLWCESFVLSAMGTALRQQVGQS